LPEAIYYVTSEESIADRASIKVTEPRNHAELDFVPQSFTWVGADSIIYLVEYYEKSGGERIAAAYTKQANYVLPETILTDKFITGKSYTWEVKGYNAEGNLIGVSDSLTFIFR